MEDWNVKGSAFRFSTENLLGAFLAGLHSSFPRTVMVSSIPEHYLTVKYFLMGHSTRSVLHGYTLGNILKNIYSVTSAKTEQLRKRKQKLSLFHLAWTLASRKPSCSRLHGVGELEFH